MRSVAQKPIASDFSYDLYINPSPIPQPGGAGDAVRLVFHPKVAQHCCHEPTTRTKDATGLAFGNTKVRKPLHSHRRWGVTLREGLLDSIVSFRSYTYSSWKCCKKIMLLKLEKPFSGGSLVKKGPKLPKRCLYVAHYLVNYSLWANFRDSLLTSCFAPIALFSFPFAGIYSASLWWEQFFAKTLSLVGLDWRKTMWVREQGLHGNLGQLYIVPLLFLYGLFTQPCSFGWGRIERSISECKHTRLKMWTRSLIQENPPTIISVTNWTCLKESRWSRKECKFIL